MSSNAAEQAAPQNPGDPSAEAMAFVKELGVEVSGNPIELPSYPEAALRVQRTLADPNADANRIAKVISGEAVLAARVINMANSAALNTTGKQVSDLRSAVQRIGFDALRSACFGFAVSQLRKAAAYRAIEKPMTKLWQENIATAAGAFVLARKFRRTAPDTAMLAGLMSGVGKLYILTRSQKYPALFGDPECYQAVVRDWHPNVARSILENWGMVEEVVEAVATYEEAHEDQRSKVTLADLVAAGDMLVQSMNAPDVLQARVGSNRAAARLGISANNVSELLAEVVAEVASLKQAMH